MMVGDGGDLIQDLDIELHFWDDWTWKVYWIKNIFTLSLVFPLFLPPSHFQMILFSFHLLQLFLPWLLISFCLFYFDAQPLLSSWYLFELSSFRFFFDIHFCQFILCIVLELQPWISADSLVNISSATYGLCFGHILYCFCSSTFPRVALSGNMVCVFFFFTLEEILMTPKRRCRLSRMSASPVMPAFFNVLELVLKNSTITISFLILTESSPNILSQHFNVLPYGCCCRKTDQSWYSTAKTNTFIGIACHCCAVKPCNFTIMQQPACTGGKQ